MFSLQNFTVPRQRFGCSTEWWPCKHAREVFLAAVGAKVAFKMKHGTHRICSFVVGTAIRNR